MLESCGARNAITNNGLLRKAERASGIGMSGQTEKKERTPFQIKPCIPNAHFLSCGSIALEIGSVHSTRGGEGPPSSLVPRPSLVRRSIILFGQSVGPGNHVRNFQFKGQCVTVIFNGSLLHTLDESSFLSHLSHYMMRN